MCGGMRSLVGAAARGFACGTVSWHAWALHTKLGAACIHAHNTPCSPQRAAWCTVTGTWAVRVHVRMQLQPQLRVKRHVPACVGSPPKASAGWRFAGAQPRQARHLAGSRLHSQPEPQGGNIPGCWRLLVDLLTPGAINSLPPNSTDMKHERADWPRVIVLRLLLCLGIHVAASFMHFWGKLCVSAASVTHFLRAGDGPTGPCGGVAGCAGARHARHEPRAPHGGNAHPRLPH